MSGRTERNRKISNGAERQIRERHVRRIKRLQRRRIIFRSTLLAVCVVLLITGIVFLTPIFNIRTLNIEGNSRVSKETIGEQLNFAQGENLFKVSKSDIRKSLLGISYISDVTVDKQWFPAEVSVIITEKKPVAMVKLPEGYGIIDSKCTILEEGTETFEGIPRLSYYHEDFVSFKEDTEASSEFKRFYDICDKIGIFDNITAIELLESNHINFEYDNRLKVICGSGLDLEKKLPLLKETVNNPALGSNAHGEIDLSTTGKAVHRS